VKKVGASFFLPILCPFFFCVSVAAQNAEKDLAEWKVAACAFSVKENSASVKNGDAMKDSEIAELLPRLISEKTASTGFRIIDPDELYRRAKKKLTDERRRLYANLENLVRERDSIVISGVDDKKLYEQIKKKEKGIDELSAQIEKNKDKERRLTPAVFKKTRERIVPWKATGELYSALEKNTYREPEDVQALINGSLTRTGAYVQVTMWVTVYPGAVEILRINATERTDKLDELAFSLAERCMFALRNAKEVRLLFDVAQAYEADKIIDTKPLIRLDGALLDMRKERDGLYTAFVPEGIHNVHAEAPGYEAASFVYDFSNKNDFYIQVRLREQKKIPVKINVTKAQEYVLFFNGVEVKKSDGHEHSFENGGTHAFSVDGFPVLTEFELPSGGIKRFVLTDKNSGNADYLFNPGDLSGAKLAGIEKKRKIMYNSYAALILSLPVSFALFGKQIDEYNSWARGNNVAGDLEKWRNASFAAAGISIGLGVNFLVQLGIYLHSVNAVLPKEIRPEKNIQ